MSPHASLIIATSYNHFDICRFPADSVWLWGNKYWPEGKLTASGLTFNGVSDPASVRLYPVASMTLYQASKKVGGRDECHYGRRLDDVQGAALKEPGKVVNREEILSRCDRYIERLGQFHVSIDMVGR